MVQLPGLFKMLQWMERNTRGHDPDPPSHIPPETTHAATDATDMLMRRVFRFAQRTFPQISRTEQIALESGTAGIERFAFAGTLTSRHLDRYRPSPLSPNDALMLERLPALVQTANEHDTLRRRVTPPDHPFWHAAREKGFFGLIVPDEYGGTRLSNTGLSSLLQRLASVSASLPVHVMVPASLGPAELIAHYGTASQREHYLPRLADGAIPCFGLTSLHAGSDAAGSMTDTGTAFRRSDGSIGLRLQCEKRYITLAPVADVVGLAFKLNDPEGLLRAATGGREVDGEITLALLERGTPGLRLGPYTDPLGLGFANGTVVADGVEIGLEHVIGGAAGLGEGWKFLMEALAAGRGIALPAGAAGSSKMLTNAVAAYSVVRKQFKVPIATFEGIQEKVCDMALKTYEIDSLVALMNSVLDAGERPPILSAILKQRTTELARGVVLHAMDVVAGSAICMGDQNFVAPAYLSSPVGITVEGSNTMTRSLLIFGQGLMRSHPHLLQLVHAIQRDDEGSFGTHTRDLVWANARLLTTVSATQAPLERFVHFFALSANASLLLGGQLKRREFLSGRYADMLSLLIAGFAMRWHGEHSRLASAIVDAAATHTLHRLWWTATDLVRNHPHSHLHRLLLWKTVGSRPFCDIDDATRATISREMTTHASPLRALFAHNTLPHLHANLARLDAALGADEATRDALRDDILKVDLFAVRDGRLVRPTDGR